MRSFFSWIIAILFVTFVSIPPILSFITPDVEISKFEKRKFADWPQLEWNIKSLRTFPSRFEKYYNDHFGLRDFLVMSHQLFSFRVFNISSSPMVTSGKEGWLFFNGDNALESYLGKTSLSGQELQVCRQTIKDRRDWLAGMGIKYLFVPVPNKWNIYSEFVPWRIRRLAGKGVYDQIVPFLENKPDFTEYIDLQRVLLSKKGEAQLYFKTDTHWNINGAMLAYDEILDKLEDQQIFPHRLQPEDIEIDQVEFSGDLARSLHLTNFLQEMSPKLGAIKKCRESEGILLKKKKLADRFQKFATDKRPFRMIQRCSEDNTSVLFIHDSFGFFLYPLFTETFGTFFYVNRGIERVKDFIEWVQPDLVIDERVERNLFKSLTPSVDITRGAMKANFLRSTNTRLLLDHSTVIGDTRDVIVLRKDNGWRVRSVGGHPALLLKYDPGPEGVHLVARIQLTSQEEGMWYLRSSIATQSSKPSDQVMSRHVKKGFNEFFFRLSGVFSKGESEFHAGSLTGEYLLHSFTIKQIVSPGAP